MRSAADGGNELSTRARIRDAAIRRFAAAGFSEPVRALAAEADVSPALVIHHFGSKAGLRAECDRHVQHLIREAKTGPIGGAPPAEQLAQLAAVEQYAPVAGYVVQALLAGGDLAAAFLDSLVADAQVYLQQGVEAGTLRPSRDPAARARFLVHIGIGGLLVHLRRFPPGEGGLAAALRSYAEQTTLPALELYTEGLLTDPGLLEAYRAPGSSVAHP